MTERTETHLLDDLVNRPAERGDLPNRPTTRPQPDGWTWTELGNVLTFIGSGITPRGGKAVYRNSGVKFLRSQNVYPGELRLEEVAYVTLELHEDMARTHVQGGDVLLNITGASIGRSAVVPHGFGTANVNQHVCILRLPNSILPAYLCWYLNSPHGQDWIMGTQSGVTRQGLNYGQIREMVFPLAPFSEQERIVAEIEKQFTRLDQAVVSLRRLQTNLARYKASVLKAACEGRLVPQDPTDEPAETLLQRILSERRTQWQTTHPGKKYEERGRVITSELPNLPDDWITVTLADILADIQTGPFGSSLHKSDYVVGGIPVINPASILDGKIRPMGEMAIDNATRERLSQFILKEGDVIMGRRGEMGRSAMVTEKEAGWLCGTGSLILRFAQDVSRKYIVYLFSSESTKAYLGNASVGTTMQNLNQKILLNMTIGLPPLAEQHRIVAEVERRLSVITTLEQTLTTNLARAERLRQSILHRAFTGQLV